MLTYKKLIQNSKYPKRIYIYLILYWDILYYSQIEKGDTITQCINV